jgi:DNA polymerase (family X)
VTFVNSHSPKFFSKLEQKEILKSLKLLIQLMELHQENAFKIRSYQTALSTVERSEGIDLNVMSLEELQNINGIGKSIGEFLFSLKMTGSHPVLEEFLDKTPTGILEILKIKGLGPKKVKILWEEMSITSIHELKEACQSGQIALLKGFGQKTQEGILKELAYQESNVGKWLYADVEESIENLLHRVKGLSDVNNVAIVGDYARKLEIIDQVFFLIGTDSIKNVYQQLLALEELVIEKKKSSPIRWSGIFKTMNLDVTFSFIESSNFLKEKWLRSSSSHHLAVILEQNPDFFAKFKNANYKDEEEIYQEMGVNWIPEEMREGVFELTWAKSNHPNDLIEMKDLKGILHNHSTYSDGRHTLKEMALECKRLGYEYLGIADHSKSAGYAGGLSVERVEQQHAEIQLLNQELAPFKILKGIESDILVNGDLDYPEEVLQQFDFIVASIHSGMNMDKGKATSRLLKAIENPYTTILGHPTGRLLLRREGYPIDHAFIIDACASNGVVIEINANPWRLDLDWRWVNYAMEKGVKLAINPDAHAKEGYMDMKYGVYMGRKGGLTREMTFNALTLEELEEFLKQKKRK